MNKKLKTKVSRKRDYKYSFKQLNKWKNHKNILMFKPRRDEDDKGVDHPVGVYRNKVRWVKDADWRSTDEGGADIRKDNKKQIMLECNNDKNTVEYHVLDKEVEKLQISYLSAKQSYLDAVNNFGFAFVSACHKQDGYYRLGQIVSEKLNDDNPFLLLTDGLKDETIRSILEVSKFKRHVRAVLKEDYCYGNKALAIKHINNFSAFWNIKDHYSSSREFIDNYKYPLPEYSIKTLETFRGFAFELRPFWSVKSPNDEWRTRNHQDKDKRPSNVSVDDQGNYIITLEFVEKIMDKDKWVENKNHKVDFKFPFGWMKRVGSKGLGVVDNKVIYDLRELPDIEGTKVYKAKWYQKSVKSHVWKNDYGFLGVRGDAVVIAKSISNINKMVRAKTGKNLAKELIASFE